MVFDPNDPGFEDFLNRLPDEHGENLEELLQRWINARPSMREPLRFEKGKLLGDAENLHLNVVYHLGDQHLLQLIPGADEHATGFRLYKINGDQVQSLYRETCEKEGELEYKLASLVRHHGALSAAGPERSMAVVRFLQAHEHGESEEASRIAYDAAHLVQGKPEKLPEHFDGRLKQAAEDALDCAYKPVRPPVRIVSEIPKVEPSKLSSVTQTTETTVEHSIAEAVTHTGGGARWLLAGGIVASAVAIGAYVAMKDRRKTDIEVERRLRPAEPVKTL